MAETPTVLFCVGAAKAGTSWFHGYLESHAQCHLRSIKELHYFDALDRGNLNGQREAQEKLRDGFRTQLAAGRGNPDRMRRQIDDRSDWLRVLDRGDEDIPAYLAYLTADAGSARLVGDVTPAYALLDEARLRQMAAIAPDVRFIYLLRDPVERLWSHVRMISGRRSPDGTVVRRRTDRILARALAGEEGQIAQRGDYRAAMTKLRAAVDPDRLHFAFYEEMFEGQGLRRMLEFLGLRWHPPATSRKVHEGQALEMLRDQRRGARDWLAPQYDHVASVMGRLPDSWQSAKVRA